MNKCTDAYYVEKIQAGETECFAALLERYGQSVFSLIFKITGNREDAEELTQDVFLKVFRSLSSFQGNSLFSTWLYRIAYNVAVSATRKKKMEWLAIEESMIENATAIETNDEMEQIDKEEQLCRLDKAVGQLPPDERALVSLFYLQEKPVEEIVMITGLSHSNVKTKLHRIRKKLWIIMQSMA
ncbi:MAG: sigma-70 family RNA polymerase sigma factor [Tannerella sp.]|jgi:RNA polymerase sigma-70 factor (ECF subfamily)|nr:sigma-70 family RNA polymerase sigma factor [Tannerella sp.]